MYFYELLKRFFFQNLEASDKKHLNSHPILGIIVLILTCINVRITNLQLPYITFIILLIKIMCNNYLYKSSHYLFKLWNYFIKMCNVEFYLIKTFFYLLVFFLLFLSNHCNLLFYKNATIYISANHDVLSVFARR